MRIIATIRALAAPQSIAELVTRTGASRQTLSYRLGRLERLGLVRRTDRHRATGRAGKLSRVWALTRAGRLVRAHLERGDMSI